MKTHLRFLMIALMAMIGTISNANAQPTITTTLGATATAYEVVPFTVQATKDNATAANVKVVLKLTGDNAATQAAQVELKTAAGDAITFNGTEAVLGTYAFAATLSQDFTVKFNAISTFPYTLELRDAANEAVLASANGAVVVDFGEPTINSTLDTYDDIKTNKAYLFNPFVVAGDRAGEMVNLTLTFTDAAQAQNVKLYRGTNAEGTIFEELTFVNGVATVGPEGGYPLANAGNEGQNLFKIIFSEAGVYNYTFKLERIDGVTLATNPESVTVVEGATIATTLNNRADVVATITEEFEASATVGTWDPTTMVNGRLTLTNPAQVDNITLEYLDTDNTYKEIIIGTDGVATIGPAGGMPISDLSGLDFRATFDAAGTYAYKLELIKISGNEVIATSNESVVVRAFVNATIASNLNNRTGVKTTVPQNATVTVVANDNAGESVLAKLTLADASQRENVTLEIRTGENTYEVLPIDANGVVYFGPATGFPLANAATDIRVTFDEAGTYAYTLALVTAGETETVIASSNESVTVTAFQNATIATTLNNRADVKTLINEEFTVSATAGDVDPTTMVVGRLTLNTPAQADDITLKYRDAEGNYQPITIGTDGVVTIGPATGMMLSELNNLFFEATFDAAGTYGYKIELVRVSDNAVLATSNESVVVRAIVMPTIASNLNNRADVKATVTQDVAVTTVANDLAGRMVRVKLTLKDAADRANVSLQYLENNNTYQPLPIAENGVAYFGPASGFPLSDATTPIKVTFNAAGTYEYTLAIVTVGDTEDVLASANESVVVAAFQNATLASNYTNANNIIVNEETTFTLTTTKGDLTNRTGRFKFILNDAAQANNIIIENTDASESIRLVFGTDGVAFYMPAAGPVAVSDQTYNFTAKFGAAGTYNYTVQLIDAVNAEVLASTNVSVEAKTATSIKKGFEKGSFAVYPTLTTGAVKVDLVNARNASIQVIDMMGRAVVAKNNQNGIVELDLSKVAKGTYIVRIQDGSSINTQRVVVR